MNCYFRKLEAADIPMILRMNEDFRENFIEKDSILRFLSDNRNVLFASIMDGIVIGFAYGYVLSRMDNKPDMLYIHEVGVMKKYQHQGIGFEMMTKLKSWCRENNINKYFLSCYQNNIGANRLYKKLGGSVPPESQGNDTLYFFLT